MASCLGNSENHLKCFYNWNIYQIIYYLQNLHEKCNEEYLHTVITGPPGCGKTTVAEIIGKIYSKMKILSDKNIFKIAKREDFVGEYLGQTAIKTKKVLNSIRLQPVEVNALLKYAKKKQ